MWRSMRSGYDSGVEWTCFRVHICDERGRPRVAATKLHVTLFWMSGTGLSEEAGSVKGSVN